MPAPSRARRALGVAGEDRAAAWYAGHGYEVVARNWRCSAGEIDLIARSPQALVFCEVKARTSDAFGTAAEAVGPTKQARIRRLAARWLDGHAGPRPRSVRFDVVAITGGELTVIEGAF